MCGIYGMIGPPDRPLRHPQCLDAMGDRLRHRGPDGSGRVVTDTWALGSERLRIIDLSDRGDQPVPSADGGAWLVANGEIYNAPALATEYDDYPFRSTTDVEVLHPLIARRGAGGLSAVRGMFALAHWDARRRQLLMARDPAGEKPLFVAELAGEIWFASELNALLVHPELDGRLDPDAIVAFLALGYVSEPRTPFQAIRKLPAGWTAFWSPASNGLRISPLPVPAGRTGDARSAGDASHALRERVAAAVAIQLRSDVPVGVFMSGGLDSALVAALAANQLGAERLTTFTVRFADPSYDEGDPARRLARHIGTNHQETRADWDALDEALIAVVNGLAEPLADPALLPTWLLARCARQHVGVVLSGEGADELFGGYPTYLGHRWAGAATAFPPSLRAGIHGLLSGAAASASRVPIAFLLSRFLEAAHEDWAHRHVTWFGTGLYPYLGREARDRFMADLAVGEGTQDPVRDAMTFDYRTYLRDGLLAKLDRATMAHGLEARSPYLDPPVVGLSRALGSWDSVGRMATKRVLRSAARGLVPRWVLHRRKRGLSVPVAAWINGPLQTTVDRLLHPDAIRNDPSGVLSTLPIAQLLTEHRQGRRNHARALWALIVFQLWQEHWVSGANG